jgi:aspartyl-tRNA(Asn)/glutamyl-tRNA(Gln) amidotransferase subunit B
MLKTLANIITTNLISISEKENKKISDLVTDQNLLVLAKLFEERKINNQGLGKALDILIQKPELEALNVVNTNGLIQVDDDDLLGTIVEAVIEANPTPVAQYKAGKEQVIGFLVGQCMKESKGKGNPQKFTQILKEKLKV